MAVAVPGLKAAIISELSVLGAVTDSSKQSDFAEALAKVIVNYLLPNIVVTVTSVAGVTTGGGVSGPGTGTVA